MNSGHSLPNDAWARIDDLLNGKLDAEQIKLLDRALKDNPEAQKEYAEYCQMHINLAIEQCTSRSVQVFLRSIDDPQPDHSRAVPALTSDVAAREHGTITSCFSSYGISIGICAFAVVAGFLLTVSIIFGPTDQQLAGQQNVQSPAAPLLTSHTIDDGSSTTLEIPAVGKVTLYGPAQFQFLSPMRARLDRGRLRMRVTEKSGHGFVIETPDGEITDLGTEFGVDVSSGKDSALAVFEGVVDLKISDSRSKTMTRVERLLGGDGVLFNKSGQLDRLKSIMTGDGAKFLVRGESSAVSFDNPIIVDVYDSLPLNSTKRCYEIVPKGMKDDALAFVDRLEHEWNGISRAGRMPKYLVGGDYVKTFNDHWRNDFEMTVVLSRPACLYVLFDKRLTIPKWLKERFKPTYDIIGLDTGRYHSSDPGTSPDRIRGVGAGQSIDHEFTVWKQVVKAAGPVVLGRNGVYKSQPQRATMYGVVATEIEPEVPSKPSTHDKLSRSQKSSIGR